MTSNLRFMLGTLAMGIVMALILSAPAALCAEVVSDSLTLEQKLEDFEYLHRMVSENYPFLWVNERVNGVDWQGEKDEYRQLIEETESYEDFRRAVAHILSRLNNDHTHILRSEPSGTTRSAGSNVTTATIEEGRVAYIRIRSFSSRYIEQDREQVLEFLASVRDYPNLLIDIRGNGGGSGAYWRQLLVAPLIDRPIAWRWYLAVRSGEAVQDYMKNRLGAGYYFLQVGRGDLPGLQNVPREVFTEDFIEPIQLPEVIFPRNPVGFRGRILLLVDERVYSSSETFAAFAKTTGWATLVGTVTGGDGIGFDPMVFTLPNSRLNIRMSESMGLNPDGTANEEAKTVPDVLVDTDSAADSQHNSTQSQGDPILEAALELCPDTPKRAQGSGGLMSRLGWMWKIAEGFTGQDIGLAELSAAADFSKYEGMEVESVEVYGAFDTDESLVRRIVGIEPGDRFSSDALGLARKRLQLTSAFRSSALLARPAGEGKVKVVVFIQEGWSLYLSPRDIGRRTVEDMLSNRISLNVYNAGGNLVNVRALYGLNAGSSRSLHVELPVFAGPLPLKLSVGVGFETSGATLSTGTHAGSSYAVEASTTALEAQTALSERSTFSIKFSHSSESVRKLSSSTGLLMNDGEYIGLSLTVAGSSRGSASGVAEESTSGSYEVSAGAVSSTGSPSLHGFATASSVSSIDLSQKSQIVLSGRAGVIDSSAPASKWFLVGGDHAFPEYSRSLLGHTYVSANAELRYFIRGDLSIGALVGLGKVWDTEGSYGLENPMTRVGAVVRYMTPLSLALEARYYKSMTDSAERFSLGISESF